MAQQSARRGWDNQGLPQCFEHAPGDLDLARELPCRPAAVFCRFKGQTDDSIRPRATMIPKFSLAWEGRRPQMESSPFARSELVDERKSPLRAQTAGSAPRAAVSRLLRAHKFVQIRTSTAPLFPALTAR